MAFTIIQNTKINTGDFIFSQPENVTYPVAPLVSVKLYTPKGGELTLKIRATLYINAKDPNAPKVKKPVETANSLKLVFKYDFTNETPETCDVWYVEIDYSSATVRNLTEIVTYLKNTNKTTDIDLGSEPQISRGTTTNIPV